MLDEVFALGTRTNERHFTLQNVPQLWQLVEVMGTQELSNLRHACLVLVLIECGSVFLGIHAHGAELVDVERSAEAPYALLLKDGRSAILTLHRYVANQEERRKYDDAKEGNEEVEDTLCVAFQLIHSVKHISVFECCHASYSTFYIL